MLAHVNLRRIDIGQYRRKVNLMSITLCIKTFPLGEKSAFSFSAPGRKKGHEKVKRLHFKIRQVKLNDGVKDSRNMVSDKIMS
ncbi:hypothetical protein CEXT_579211 [Caerostris extrusa]|uniref:Uncharacterized protein n=1 Tax=Caerostris extrusa TaxID=172846 RepID=A0AAV4SYX2_CAEEX|nr:hypothetical protein CEXT_579211 [Caerostris extrusa]